MILLCFKYKIKLCHLIVYFYVTFLTFHKLDIQILKSNLNCIFNEKITLLKFKYYLNFLNKLLLNYTFFNAYKYFMYSYNYITYYIIVNITKILINLFLLFHMKIISNILSIFENIKYFIEYIIMKHNIIFYY